MADCFHWRCLGYANCRSDYIFIQMTAGQSGDRIGMQVLQTHGPDMCAGQACTIHNPSNHHMRTWQQLWQADRHRMLRMCPHDIGHPDPDDLNQIKEHVCDGCCQAPATVTP